MKEMLSNEFDKEDIEYLQKSLFALISDSEHYNVSKSNWNDYDKNNTVCSLVQITQQLCCGNKHSFSDGSYNGVKTFDGDSDYCSAFIPQSIKIDLDTKAVFNMIINKGIDKEDFNFIKTSFNHLVFDSNHRNWINKVYWDSHPLTNYDDEQLTDFTCSTPLIKTGCIRSEGFLKSLSNSKSNVSKQFNVPYNINNAYVKQYKRHKQSLSRDARNDQRRLFTAYQTITVSNLLRLNDLKFRKKKLRLGKSDIHGLGLFAYEPIHPNEIIIEYVGQLIRPIIADLREKVYKSTGIGSYCFKVDEDTIIDATKYGNLNRYINHSCNPNSYARILLINNTKKIVIYSKKHIDVGEEITYDYKLPFEDDKIYCLCKTPGCRKSLN